MSLLSFPSEIMVYLCEFLTNVDNIVLSITNAELAEYIFTSSYTGYRPVNCILHHHTGRKTACRLTISAIFNDLPYKTMNILHNSGFYQKIQYKFTIDRNMIKDRKISTFLGSTITQHPHQHGILKCIDVYVKYDQVLIPNIHVFGDFSSLFCRLLNFHQHIIHDSYLNSLFRNYCRSIHRKLEYNQYHPFASFVKTEYQIRGIDQHDYTLYGRIQRKEIRKLACEVLEFDPNELKHFKYLLKNSYSTSQ